MPSDAGVAGVSQALIDDIIAAALAEFQSALVCVALGGSRVKGTARESSDLDVHVVHTGGWYQKRFVGGANNADGIDIDFSIDPIGKLVTWILRFRGYADFFTTAKIVYPNPPTDDAQGILQLAQRVRDEPAALGYESTDHYKRYGTLRRMLMQSQHAVAPDRKLVLATVIVGIAELRLLLAGDHHIRMGSLIAKVTEIDPRLAVCLKAALNDLEADQSYGILLEALAALKPANDFYLAEKLFLVEQQRE